MTTQNTSIGGLGYGSPYVDSLVWGHAGWNTGSAITYWFGTGTIPDPFIDQNPGYTADSWSTPEVNAFISAMNNFSAVCNLTFQQASNRATANIVWWQAPDAFWDDAPLGEHEVPSGTANNQVMGWFDYQDPSWSHLNRGEYGYVTIVHEIGHGMGLAHPHGGGDQPDATVFPGVSGTYSIGDYGLNQGIWTIMSYNDGWNQVPTSSTSGYGWEGGLGALDIAALQAMYGANQTYHSASDTYVLPTNDSFWSCIWDAGGVDTISNAGSNQACIINLQDAPLTGANAGGFVSWITGTSASNSDDVRGGFTIAHNAIIENATGGSGDDTIYGNVANNRLDGGGGIDTVVFQGTRSDYSFAGTATNVTSSSSSSGVDTILNCEFIRFAGSNETLRISILVSSTAGYSAPTSTAPSTAVTAFLGGFAPTQDDFYNRSDFCQNQYNYYSNVLHVMNPQLGPYEALGKSFGDTSAFATKYGLSVDSSTTAFVLDVYQDVFGVAPTTAQQNAFISQVNYFINIYRSVGIPDATAQLEARGAVMGQMVGYVMTDTSISSNPGNSLDNQVSSFLTKVASGNTAVFGQPWETASADTAIASADVYNSEGDSYTFDQIAIGQVAANHDLLLL